MKKSEIILQCLDECIKDDVDCLRCPAGKDRRIREKLTGCECKKADLLFLPRKLVEQIRDLLREMQKE